MMRDHDDLHDEQLRLAAQRLGAEAADRLDVEQTAAAVLSRLRTGRTPARPMPLLRTRRAWLAAAAVVALVIGAVVLARHGLTSRVPVVVDTVSVPTTSPGDLANLTPAQLRDVLAALEEEVETVPPVHAGEAGLEDLSEPELQTLLHSMED